MDLVVRRVAAIQGQIRPPSDKSLTHRAYMLGAVATSPSTVLQPLVSQDCEDTLKCLEAMGLSVESLSSGEKYLVPAPEWRQPEDSLYCGNSGTSMRLLSGLIASRRLEVVLEGDQSLNRRPMGRIATPLRLMGAEVVGDTPPLVIRGTDAMIGIDYQSPVSSAQVKSCILFAGLRASGTTTVREAHLSRDHTERMLNALGVPVLRGQSEHGASSSIKGGEKFPGFNFSVPADISSAAFFLVATCIVPSSRLVIFDVGINPTRTGILHVLDHSGVSYSLDNIREELSEPVADIEVRTPNFLLPFKIEGDLVPKVIDEIPILSVLATQCDGVSSIKDASELRLKESDRIDLIARNLRAMGAEVETRPDGLLIKGPCQLQCAEIETGGDHRIAMSFAIAGLIAEGTTTIKGAESIATSYPDFEQQLWSVAVV